MKMGIYITSDGSLIQYEDLLEYIKWQLKTISQFRFCDWYYPDDFLENGLYEKMQNEIELLISTSSVKDH